MTQILSSLKHQIYFVFLCSIPKPVQSSIVLHFQKSLFLTRRRLKSFGSIPQWILAVAILRLLQWKSFANGISGNHSQMTSLGLLINGSIGSQRPFLEPFSISLILSVFRDKYIQTTKPLISRFTESQ